MVRVPILLIEKNTIGNGEKVDKHNGPWSKSEKMKVKQLNYYQLNFLNTHCRLTLALK